MRIDPARHITDSDLLRASDGELSKHRIAEIQSHLAACWACRTRSRDIENSIADFLRNYELEDSTALPPLDRARHRLEVELEYLARSTHRSKWERAFQMLFSFRPPAYISAGLVLAVVYFIAVHTGAPPLHASLTPDTQLTPGATRRVTKDDICAAGSSDEIQSIPAPLALRVFQEYGIHTPAPRTYEIDYLITPALGGSADIRNLWPQPYTTGAWNSHVKDALEDRLRDLVCEGKLDLATAQNDIASDWIAAYQKYFKTSAPLEIHAGFALDPPWE